MRKAIRQVSEVSIMEPSQNRFKISPGALVNKLMTFIKAQEKLIFWGNAMALKPDMGALKSGMNQVQPELAMDLMRMS